MGRPVAPSLLPDVRDAGIGIERYFPLVAGKRGMWLEPRAEFGRPYRLVRGL